MNKRMENRKENRKAFPGFLLLCLAGGLVGAQLAFVLLWWETALDRSGPKPQRGL